MKKIIKTFTFWFVILGITVIAMNRFHLDDMSILLIGLNPILNLLSSSPYSEAISNTPNLWYVLSFITTMGYGLSFDGIRYLIKIHKTK